MWRIAGPAERAAADRLAGAVPEWLVSAIRTNRAPVPWDQMIRAAIAICAPLAAGMATGQRSLGLLIAMGGLLGTVVDNGGAYAIRVKRVGSAAVFGGMLGLGVGSLLHGRGWIAVAALVVVTGLSAVISSISDIGSVTGLQLLIYTALGLGPLGALRPWWHTELGVALGAAWALLLTVPGWLRSPRGAERSSVAAVYQALEGQLRAIGSAEFTPARQALTAAFNSAYDTLLTVRSTAGGRSPLLNQLIAMANQANLIAEAAIALGQEGRTPPPLIIRTMGRLAEAIAGGGPAPVVPGPWGTGAGAVTLNEAVSGAIRVLSRDWGPRDAPVRPRPAAPERLGAAFDRMLGWRTRMFALRLMASVAVAGVMIEVVPLQRSYWVVLTVAIVLKPDFGSVFARAVQRGLGTVLGAVLGAVILVIVPYGPWLLLPLAILAGLLPFGRSRGFGLLATFLTPLVVVLIDLLARGGWQLAEARLLDTLLGCAIVLAVGYAPWPMSWQAHLPDQFAQTIGQVRQYLLAALGGAEDRSRLRRRTYRALSDLREEFERTMAEPRAISRRASAWWPAAAGLEDVVDAVTATAVAVGQGAPAPDPAAVRGVAEALDAVAGSVRAGACPVRIPVLASDERLAPVTEAVRAVLGVLAQRSSPEGQGDVEPSDRTA